MEPTAGQTVEPTVEQTVEPSWFRKLIDTATRGLYNAVNPSVRLAEMMAKAAYRNNQTELQKQDAIRPYFYKARQDALERQAKILQELEQLQPPPMPEYREGRLGKEDYIATLLGGLIRPGSINESLAHLQALRRAEAQRDYELAMSKYAQDDTGARKKNLEERLRREEEFLRQLELEQIRQEGRESEAENRMEREVARQLFSAAKNMTPDARREMFAANPWLAQYADSMGQVGWQDMLNESTIEDRRAAADLKRANIDFLSERGDTEAVRRKLMEAQATLAETRAKTEEALRKSQIELNEARIKQLSTQTELLPQEVASRIATNLARADSLRRSILLRERAAERGDRDLANQIGEMPRYVNELYRDRRHLLGIERQLNKQKTDYMARGNYVGEVAEFLDRQLDQVRSAIEDIDAEISFFKPVVDSFGERAADLVRQFAPDVLPSVDSAVGSMLGSPQQGEVEPMRVLGIAPMGIPSGPIGPANPQNPPRQNAPKPNAPKPNAPKPNASKSSKQSQKNAPSLPPGVRRVR